MFFSLSHINNNNNNNNNGSNGNNGNNNNNNNNNGYRLLSAQGMETLQTFLREHGNECIKQFVKVTNNKYFLRMKLKKTCNYDV